LISALDTPSRKTRLKKFTFILCDGQMSTPVIYFLITMTSQRDVINETTINDVDLP